MDGTTVTVTFHVVDDRDILYPALIGNDVLKYVNMTIGCGGVRFSPKTFTDEHKSELEYNISVMQDAFKELANIDVICQLGDQLQMDHLHESERLEVLKMVEEYKPMKPKSYPVEMKIILSDEVPVWHSPRRMSFVDQQTVDQQVKEWLKEGIIRPSFSQYSSPVVLVSKKDGSKRIVLRLSTFKREDNKGQFPNGNDR